MFLRPLWFPTMLDPPDERCFDVDALAVFDELARQAVREAMEARLTGRLRVLLPFRAGRPVPAEGVVDFIAAPLGSRRSWQ
jgi:hypothetical protein